MPLMDFPGPMAYDSQKDVLYHNKGDGTFEDVTQAMGIVDIDGRAMGVGVTYDDDALDIYVANDHTLNYLGIRRGKKFTDRGIMSDGSQPGRRSNREHVG